MITGLLLLQVRKKQAWGKASDSCYDILVSVEELKLGTRSPESSPESSREDSDSYHGCSVSLLSCGAVILPPGPGLATHFALWYRFLMILASQAPEGEARGQMQ